MEKTEKEFWSMTPRKLNALIEIRSKYAGGKSEEAQNSEAFKMLMKS